MARRMIALLICLTVVFAAFGCSSILEDEELLVSPHDEPTNTTQDSVIEAASYSELKTAIVSFIKEHEDTGLIRVSSYDGSIEEDVSKVCEEIVQTVPLGAYAVSELTGSVTQTVSFYDVQILITYKKTKEQVEHIIKATTLRYLKSELLDMLSSYTEYSAVSTNISGVTTEEVLEYVEETYYENPLDIVMIPVTSVEFYPTEGTERIIEFTFAYPGYKPGTLRAMENSLLTSVQRIAQSVGGDSDGAILVSLGQRLMEKTEYDFDTAASGDYSNQNISATAYGALVKGKAVGEGYAMAYKALCDQLGLECYVVKGFLGSADHAWNIVALDGFYYHIDISLCDVNGIETAFLKNDTDMIQAAYMWESWNYKVCDGPLTYESITEAASD